MNVESNRGGVYGFLKVNYEWEVYARTTTQGSELQIAATFLVPSLWHEAHGVGKRGVKIKRFLD